MREQSSAELKQISLDEVFKETSAVAAATAGRRRKQVYHQLNKIIRQGPGTSLHAQIIVHG